MPQGERRETVLHGVRRQEIVLSVGRGEFRLDELPQGECREIVMRMGVGGWGWGWWGEGVGEGDGGGGMALL